MKYNLSELSKTNPVGDILWAEAYMAEGNHEAAMASLQKAAASYGVEFPYEIRNPMFDPLRSDPRYIEMMKSRGFPL
jgi:hypothetical protein